MFKQHICRKSFLTKIFFYFLLFLFFFQTVYARTIRSREQVSPTEQSFLNLFVPAVNLNWHATLNKNYLGADLKINLIYGTSLDKQTVSALRYEFFVETGLFYNAWQSTNPNIRNDYFFTYLLGGNVSFNRSHSSLQQKIFYFVPYTSLRFGGMYYNLNVQTGLLVIPALGLSFISAKTYSVSLELGAFLNSSDFESLFGLTPKLIIHYSF